MLNAMPLPIGPTEIPGGPAKVEKSRKAPHNGGTEENIASFASTLEAVHKTSQSMRSANPQCADEPSVSPAPSKEEDGALSEEEHATSSDAVIDLLMPSPAVSEPLADPEFVDTTIAGDSVSESSVSMMDPDLTDGTAISRKQSIVSRQVQTGNAPASLPQNHSAIVQDEAGVTPDGQEAIQDTQEQSQAKTNAIKMAAGADHEVSPDIGKPASKDAADVITQTARVVEDVPYRKIAEGKMRPATDAAAEKAATTEVPLENVDPDAGELSPNKKGNLSQHVKAMGTEHRKTETAASSQGPSKAEPVENQSGHTQATDDPAARQKPWGDAVRETPVQMMNDETGPLTGRQGAFDPTVSFSPAATGSKPAMATGNTPAAASPPADIFHQENFNQLVERALITVRGAQSEARIALKPDQLGHVQMKIVTENNLVTIRIMTESPVARDLIDANAHQLKTELQQQGLNVESIQVSVSDEQQDADRGARQREAFLRQMAAKGRPLMEDELDQGEYRASQPLPERVGTTGIDYFA
jgi:flagellar hook-length control protein FliK